MQFHLYLLSKFLLLRTCQSFTNNLSIELKINKRQRIMFFQAVHNLNLNNYISPVLKFKDLKSSLLIQMNQFIDIYTTFIYFEDISLTSLEIVKFKVNQRDTKRILLISNNNCIKVEKTLLPNKLSKVIGFINFFALSVRIQSILTFFIKVCE